MQQGKAQEAGEVYAALSARYPTNRKLALARAALVANDPATALETQKRRDDRLRAGVEIAYALSNEAAYYYTNAFSTSNLYTYDQHVVNLGIARTF